MKRSHIIGIALIAVAVAFILTSVSTSSSYADFSDAFGNPGKEFHVVGTLDKEAEIIYNPENNPNLTEFTMIDGTGARSIVLLNKSKPQDFERSESVVLIGRARGDQFIASDMLMKCPSKYKQEGKFDINETASK